MPKSPLPRIGAGVGRNGYLNFTDMKFFVHDYDKVDINFFGARSNMLNAGGWVNKETFINEAKQVLEKLGFAVIKMNTSRTI